MSKIDIFVILKVFNVFVENYTCLNKWDKLIMFKKGINVQNAIIQ